MATLRCIYFISPSDGSSHRHQLALGAHESLRRIRMLYGFEAIAIVIRRLAARAIAVCPLIRTHFG